MFLKRISKTTTSMLAAAVVMTALAVGCSDDDNGGGTERDPRLFSRSNDAWAICLYGCEMLRFLSNGDVVRVFEIENGVWIASPTPIGTWHTNDYETMTLNHFDYGEFTGTYRILSDGVFSFLGVTAERERVNITTFRPGGDNRLVTGNNQEWVTCYGAAPGDDLGGGNWDDWWIYRSAGWDDDEWCYSIMFRANGEFWEFWFEDDIHWEEYHEGDWFAMGSNRLLFIDPWGGIGTAEYRLSNNGNTLEINWCWDQYYCDDYAEVYTKQTARRPNGGGGNLVLSSGRAWTYAHEYRVGNRDGMIFLSNGRIQFISDYRGIWEIEEESTYSTSSGGILNIGGRVRMNYTVSGNYVKLGGWGELVRTNNVIIGGSNQNSTPLGKTLADDSAPSLSRKISEDEKRQRPFARRSIIRERRAEQGMSR